MSSTFNFKQFCKDASLSQDTIDVLTSEKFDDEITLKCLDGPRISEFEDLKSGEKVRLELALNDVFGRPDTFAHVRRSGDTSGAVGGAGVNIKQENTDGGPPITENPVSRQFLRDASPEPEKVTTTSLARDSRINALVDELLSDGQQFAGLKDLISLSNIKSSLDNKLKGEKPLLIGDFLTSSINVSYVDQELDVDIGVNTKLVVKKQKRPKVEEYTPALWSGASFRILLHLLKSGAASSVVEEYAEYSSMVSDYLEIYVPKGVYLLDFEHRHRVAREGRSWSDISSHDERRYLRFSDTKESSAVKPKTQRNRKRWQSRKLTDANGDTVCVNFNTKGCSYGAACRFSHTCSNAGCGGKHPQNACPKMPQKFKD